MDTKSNQYQYVMSRLNLLAVLKALEELVRLDSASRHLIEETDLTLRFSVRKGPDGYIRFRHGEIEVYDGIPERCDIHLWFISPAHLNRMIDGKAPPVPLKGFTRLSFLTGVFSRLAERLEYFLKPDEAQLANRALFETHTRLLGYVAFHALSQVGNHDHQAQQSARNIPDGWLQVQAGDDYGICIESQNGVMRSQPGFAENPRCTLWFVDLYAMFGVLSGHQHIYDLMGRNQAGMHGFIPMVDNLSPVLGRTSDYLG